MFYSFLKKYIFATAFLLFVMTAVHLPAERVPAGIHEIRDADGILHKPAAYKRIVPLSPNLTEICIALGLKDHLAGASVYGDQPEIVKVPKIDGWKVNYETILLLKPDLVLTTSAGNTQQVVKRLRALGLNVFHTKQENIPAIYDTILTIGDITSSRKNADIIVSRMKKELEEIRSGFSGNRRMPRVLYLIWASPIMAVGEDNFLSEMISISGGRNIFVGSGLKIIRPSLEKIIDLDPEIIFLPEGTKPSELDKRWKVITAVKNGRVFNVNENLVLRPGINTIRGIRELSQLIHPKDSEERKK